ncbi:MAG: alkaline phosphatase family protein [Lentisphaeria bacterium]|nr:alkaline phosphatase family protein [Lentisphaeria bacterium]
MDLESKEVFDSLQKKYGCRYCIGDLTPTVCHLFGVPAPETCGGEVIPEIADQADKLMGGEGRTQRAVLFCADALGENQRRHFPEDFALIEKVAGFRIRSVSVMPSVTPVCYGTIFTGAAPCVHGIQKYEKPVIKIKTLFDAFAAAGKNVAVLACNGCSIDTIFRQRKVDYYSFHENRPGELTAADGQAFEFTRRFIREDRYDLLVCYMTNYDHQMHLHGPYSPEAAEQARLAARRFKQLQEDMDEYWAKYNRALVFVPDHGGHPTDETHGGHGSDLPEDMIVNHYYRICEGR